MKIPAPFPVTYIEFGLFAVVAIGVIGGFFATALSNMNFEQIFNLGEGVLWVVIAGCIYFFAQEGIENTE